MIMLLQYMKSLRNIPKNAHCRFLCSSPSMCNNKTLKENETFSPIYKFPIIAGLSSFNKLKLYQTWFTGIGIPSSIILNQLSIIPTEYIYGTIVVGFTGCISLYTVGFLTQKFVGFIYLNKEQDLVKFSYIDFWGRRVDETVPIQDVSPFCDLDVSFTDKFFYKLKIASKAGHLKLNMSHGQILDEDKFNKVFMPV